MQNNNKVNGEVTDIIIDDEVILEGSEDSFDDESEITDEQVKEIYDNVQVADDEDIKYNTSIMNFIFIGGTIAFLVVLCSIIYQLCV